jgi:hypothetical protein
VDGCDRDGRERGSSNDVKENDNMQEDLIIADTQQAFFEYVANFKEPITPFWYSARQSEIISALHKALSPWHAGYTE